MKPVKMLGLVALTALMAMAVASSAMAGNTQLCKSDTSPCGSAVTHVHEATLAGAKMTLLNNVVKVECDALFLSTSVGGLGAPQMIEGRFTYTNCSNNCVVKEVGGPALVEVLKTGHETASDTMAVVISAKCGFLLDCEFAFTGAAGTARGPLLASETNGEVVISGQSPFIVHGFCPGSSFLDITLTPLSATYISS